LKSVLDIQVSCVPNYYTKQPTAPVNLLTWLSSKKYAHVIDRIRKCHDADERKRMKAGLPAITPCGLFTAVNEKSLVQHSGFMQFDVDRKDNPQVYDYFQLRAHVARIKNVAYCGLSASGQGLWGLVRIAFPEKHAQHWQYMKTVFDRYNIKIDEAPKNIASLRGYSYDCDAYFNHEATLLTQYNAAPAYIPVNPLTGTDNRSVIKRLIEQLMEREIDITEGYNNWFSLGCCIAGNFGESGRVLFHNLSQYNGKYDIETTNKKYDDCKKATKDSNIAVLVKRCKEHKVLLGR